MTEYVEIDGSTGEGGGQVLRTALSLSVATGRPIRVGKIRAGRPKPGLMRQHLTCVRAAAEISGAEVEGARIGADEIAFAPGAVRAGEYTFKVGSAGSCLLVMQTVLPPLLLAAGTSVIVLEGGTHNPAAPPWEVIERAWFPALRRMGVTVEGRLERHGFMPAGGGRAVVTVTPGAPVPFDAMDRGDITARLAEAKFANLPIDIAQRELAQVASRLNLTDAECTPREVKSDGPGNVLILGLVHDAGEEVIASFGMKQRSAETVAREAAREAAAFLASRTAIGRRLADQLLVSMVLLAGGRFTTVRPSRHTITNAEIIRTFAPGAVTIAPGNKAYIIEAAPLVRKLT